MIFNETGAGGRNREHDARRGEAECNRRDGSKTVDRRGEYNAVGRRFNRAPVGNDLTVWHCRVRALPLYFFVTL
jgi:hypothetical protein